MDRNFLLDSQRSSRSILQFHSFHLKTRMVSNRIISADVLVSKLAAVKRGEFRSEQP